MRKIIFTALFLQSVIAAGATPEVIFKNELQSAQGNLNHENPVANTSQWNQTLAVQAVELNPVQLGASLSLKNHDFSNLVL